MFVALAAGLMMGDPRGLLLVLKNRYPIPIRIDFGNSDSTLKPNASMSWYTTTGGGLRLGVYDLKGRALKGFRFTDDDLQRRMHGSECRVDLTP